jgi:hypothetical protein
MGQLFSGFRIGSKAEDLFIISQRCYGINKSVTRLSPLLVPPGNSPRESIKNFRVMNIPVILEGFNSKAKQRGISQSFAQRKIEKLFH